MQRRMLIGRRSAGLAVLSFLAFVRKSMAAPEARPADAVVRAALEAGERLARRDIDPARWQAEIDRILAGADVIGLAAAVDVDRLLRGVPRAKLGATVVAVPASRIPQPKASQVKLFAFDKGRANPPHAHDNMVSTHLVLRGRFRVRHFDRIRDEPEHVVIRPTIDRELGPGEHTSISDARDNVHWHHALSEGLLLDVVRAKVAADGPETTTQLLDPREALPTEGVLRARRIASVDEALRVYG
jgi:hypothetical protein